MSDKIQENFSLFKLLQIMSDFDDGIGDITVERFEEAAKGQKPKVDNCYEFILNCESRISIIDQKIKDLQESKSSIKRTIENFKSYLDKTMQTFDTKKLQGEYYTLYRQERKTLEIKDIELNEEIYLDLNLKKPNTVKREFKLDKNLFKKLCDKYQDIKEKYAIERVKSFVSFKSKKGVK